MPVSIQEQLKCARRELAMRRSAYPRWVSMKRMSQEKADLETAGMEAIVETLAELAKRSPGAQVDMDFGKSP